MSEEVPMHMIGRIVGAERHDTKHIARAVSEEEVVFILHSANCESFEYGLPLTSCKYSVALTRGINLDNWEDFLDVPVFVDVNLEGRLVPTGFAESM